MSDLDRMRQIIDQIERLLAELNGILANNDLLQEVDQAKIIQLISSLENIQRAKRLYFALIRVNLRNEFYRFVRAIDGDTIVVLPPDELKEFAQDIRIRLYGLETPELWEEQGKKYRQHLEDLCRIDANERLFVVWERVRGGQYENFPETSFERGIGHIFFEVSENRLVYVNGMMHLLKSSSLRRKGKLMLRGGTYLAKQDLSTPYNGECATHLSSIVKEQAGRDGIAEQTIQRRSNTWQMLEKLRPPVCLVAFPKSEILGADTNTDRQLSVLSSSIANMGCPFTSILRNYEQFNHEILSRKISPFDFPLLFISQWSASQGSQNIKEE